MAIRWNDSFSVNVKEIDDQHRKFIEVLNTFLGSMGSKDRSFIRRTLRELADYTQYHFSTEERYMDLFHYPEYARHKKEHEDFLGKVTRFQKEWENGKVTISFEIMKFLEDWTKDHILDSDRKFGPFFNQNQLY